MISCTKYAKIVKNANVQNRYSISKEKEKKLKAANIHEAKAGERFMFLFEK